MSTSRHILALNAGSSSLKAALFDPAANLRQIASAKIERIGTAAASLTASINGKAQPPKNLTAPDHQSALLAVLDQFNQLPGGLSLNAAGHRIVHGGPNYSASQPITPELLAALRQLEPFDPEHLPAQIRLIEFLLQKLPAIPHIACFDTAFHHDLPAVSRRLPLPRKFDSLGLRRYGFHGISYAFLMHALKSIDPPAANGRVILAHLGNGASLAAVHHGQSIDTTMAFTPAAGIPMGTRSGDLDPGLIDYLIRTAGITLEDFNRMVHLESGLLGISETNSDMQRLLQLESTDPRAREAVDIFCYHVRKTIGAYAAALGGLDTLIFAGGIGEHAPEIRARICQNLHFLGIDLDPRQNRASAALISTNASPVKVRVIATDEERMIAHDVMELAAP